MKIIIFAIENERKRNINKLKMKWQWRNGENNGNEMAATSRSSAAASARMSPGALLAAWDMARRSGARVSSGGNGAAAMQ
jgi:hypothetical protein